MQFHYLIFVVISLLFLHAQALDKFYLRTKVAQGNPKFDGLYPASYHTGAGQGVITLLRSKETTGEYYLEGENGQRGVTHGKLKESLFDREWRTTLNTDGAYHQAWHELTINGGGRSMDDVTVDNGVLSWKNGAFIACDWWYGVPQLFYYSN
ncbi:hypothetical protein EDC01DRAFT_725105, partial [Geopyxis carbonaria]